MKLIDANHVPGSCMFVFWIYRIINNNTIYGKPQLYIYTGDYFLNDSIYKQLMKYRYEEKCYSTTIVNDNTRESDIDYALPTVDEAFRKMKDFIENNKNQHNGTITVTIGADWGMENVWAMLAKEYKTYICVNELLYNLIQACWGEDIGQYFMIQKKCGDDRRKYSGNKIRYFCILPIN